MQICDSKTLTREITQWSKHFEGKETDDNWSLREKAIHHYRNILWGNGSVDHTEQLVALLKGAMDDILKALHSLRTTLSTAAFDLTSDIAIRLGPNALPLSTVLLENSLKFCAQSKKITAQAAYNASCTIIKYLPFQHRTIKQLAACMAEKSPSLRQYTIGIATTLLATHRISGNERLVKESLGQLSQIIRKGLTDSSPAVRTPSRELYWLFWRRHQQEADRLMVTLDPTTRTTVMREQPKY
ncbi:suppressor of tub2 mutation, partial [Spiromyces aspiralis]